MTTNDNWDMLGHKWAVDLLRNHIVKGRIGHAYLFTGPQGIGRRTLALKLAMALNCPQPVSPGIPCCECRSCKLFESGGHPDLTIVQADHIGGNLKVDQIRELQHTLSLTPYEAKYRVALLLRFEEANPNAANAILKTLEEPQSQVVMMLTAQDSESLLPTIVSRCEILRLRPLALETISIELLSKFDTETEKTRLAAHISGGRPGLALQLLQNPNIMERRQTWLEDLSHLLLSKRVERFSYAEVAAKMDDPIEDLLQIWSSFWRDVLLINSGSSVHITNLDWKTEIETLAEAISLPKAVEIVKTLQETSILLKRNANPRLTLEVLMLELPYIQSPLPIRH
jgi:DNA polymerase-3 subunit delta'